MSELIEGHSPPPKMRRAASAKGWPNRINRAERFGNDRCAVWPRQPPGQRSKAPFVEWIATFQNHRGENSL